MIGMIGAVIARERIQREAEEHHARRRAEIDAQFHGGRR